MKILSVVGARPNFIKIAPLCVALANSGDGLDHIIVHTGQHYDYQMSRDFFESLGIPDPDIHLEVGSASHAVQTAKIMMLFEEVCLKEEPHWVVVVGDVNSTAACALVSKKLGIKVAHIEAGLRSFDMEMPEEINRKVTDAISDLLFTPSADGDENLLNEGVAPEKIKMVGNIMIDTLVREMEKSDRLMPYEKWKLTKSDYVYLTLHRPSNVDNEELLKKIFNGIENLAVSYPVILPLHPRTARRIKEFDLKSRIESINGLILTEPVSYHESIGLAMNSRFVITDSGGIQEETTFMGVPCLTLRPNTERPVTITEGTNRLTRVESLSKDIERLVNKDYCLPKYRAPRFWDGHTAERIVDIFLEMRE